MLFQIKVINQGLVPIYTFCYYALIVKIAQTEGCNNTIDSHTTE